MPICAMEDIVRMLAGTKIPGSATGLGLFFILHCTGVVLSQGQTRPPYLVPYSLDCRLTKSGQEYAGPLNTTRSGRHCQAWSSDQPHFNYYKDNTNFPEGNASAAGNRCRNPDSGYHDGVWCYTTNNRVRWELCDVRLCECLSPIDPLGIQYQGQTNRTRRGQACRFWRLQYPNRHPYNESVFFPDASISEVSNYCRNPNSSRPNGPWCYVNTNLDWEYCNIPTCNQSSVILRTTRSPSTTTSALTSTRLSSTSRTSITSTKTSSTTPPSTMPSSRSTSYWSTRFPTTIQSIPSTMRSSSATKSASSTTMSSSAGVSSPGPTTEFSLTPKSSTSTTVASSSTAKSTKESSLSPKATSTAETSGSDTYSINIIKIVIPVIGAIILIAAVFAIVFWKRSRIFQPSWRRFPNWFDSTPKPEPVKEQEAAEEGGSRRREGFENPGYSSELQPTQMPDGTPGSVTITQGYASAAFKSN